MRADISLPHRMSHTGFDGRLTFPLSLTYLGFLLKCHNCWIDCPEI